MKVRLLSKDYDFVKEFRDWEAKCGGLTGDAIGTKGNRSLLEFVKNHGFSSPERNTKDQTGAKDVLAELGSLLEKKFFTEKEVEVIEKVEEMLNDMSDETANNNPANVPFGIPKKRDSEGKRVGDGTITVYGHYTGGDKNWYSEDKGKSTPPIWQALFGTGKEDLKIKGLATIVDEALEEIETPKDITITDLSREQFEKLSTSKQFQNAFVRIANANVKGKDKNTGDNRYDNKSIRSQLAEKKIKISKKDVLGIFNIENKIGAITFDLSATQIGRLLGLYFSRKIIKGDTDWKSLIKG